MSRKRKRSRPGPAAKGRPAPRRQRSRKRWGVPALLVVLGAAAAIIAFAVIGRDEGAPAGPVQWDVPNPDTSRMQPRVAGAIEERRQAVERQLGSAEAWGRYGAVCDVHNLNDVAVICYERARILAPSDFRWPYLLGYVREIEGASVDEVAALFRRAAELEPGLQPPIYFRLGDAYMREGEVEEACEAYRKAIALDPGLAIAHRSLGQALNALGDHQAALDHLERALSVGGHDGAVYAAIAQAKARLGDREGAREAAARSRRTPIVLSLPDPVRYEVEKLGISAQHCYDRAVALFQQGDYPGAIQQLQIAREHLDDDPEVHYLLGVTYARSRQRLRAIQHLSEAIRLDPRHAAAHFSLGRVLEQAGEVNEAIARYREAVAIDPESAARERLRALGAER